MIDANFAQQMLIFYREYQSVEDSPRSEKLPIIRKIFQRLKHSDASRTINTQNMVKDAIGTACLNCLTLLFLKLLTCTFLTIKNLSPKLKKFVTTFDTRKLTKKGEKMRKVSYLTKQMYVQMLSTW